MSSAETARISGVHTVVMRAFMNGAMASELVPNAGGILGAALALDAEILTGGGADDTVWHILPIRSAQDNSNETCPAHQETVIKTVIPPHQTVILPRRNRDSRRKTVIPGPSEDKNRDRRRRVSL